MTPYDEFPLAPRPPQRPRQQTVLPALVLIFFAVLLTAAGVFVYRHFFMTNRGVDPTAELRPVTPRGELPGAEQDRVQMLAHVKPREKRQLAGCVSRSMLRLSASAFAVRFSTRPCNSGT